MQDEKKELKFQLWGWILFIVCAFIFIASSIHMGDVLMRVGSLFFLVDWKSIAKPLSAVAGLFLHIFFLPMDSTRFTGAVIESLALAKWDFSKQILPLLLDGEVKCVGKIPGPEEIRQWIQP